MNLLYIWNDRIYLNEEDKGYIVNSKYDIEFNEPERRLYIRKNREYIEGFWKRNIFDVMAVVGENGSGKTKFANGIMDVLENLNVIDTTRNAPQFIVVFEDDMEITERIEVIVTDKFRNIVVESSVKYKIQHTFEREDIKNFKFGYFTNVLSLNDYKHKKYGKVFDASLGGSIRKAFDENYEMHYIDSQKDKVMNYYEYEMEKIIEFLCSDLNEIKTPFVMPKYVLVSPSDYHVNLEYITEELNKMGKNREEILHFNKGNWSILKEICDGILDKFGRKGHSYLVINLILNLFKELCIPQTTADKLEKEALKSLMRIEKLKDLPKDDIFEMALDLMNCVEDSKYIHKTRDYIEFINWLSRTLLFTGGDRNWSIDLHENKNVIIELMRHYNRTKDPFSYLSFEFGLSAGEFNFLLLFSKFAQFREKDRNGAFSNTRSYYNREKPGTLLLYLDEIDLSLHPRWQQKYLDWVLQFVASYFEEYTVQIIIATHSPIMLSDFPRNNVLYLRKDKEKSYAERRDIKTFGSNIHTLFMDSFFLDDAGTMGTFAERKINELAGDLKRKIGFEDENVEKIIDGIGDDIIRNKLLQIYNEKIHENKNVKVGKEAGEAIEITIGMMKEQIENLKNTIRELEKMKDDKN